jgi:NADPH:quinone reductase
VNLQEPDIIAVQWVATSFGGPQFLKQRRVELSSPQAGEVIIQVRAAGMNPADNKHLSAGQDPRLLPASIGMEASGIVAAIGPETKLATGGGAVGDAVIAFPIMGGYASAIKVEAEDVFAKPSNLDFPQAANLLLVATTASEMLHVTKVGRGDVVLLHGAAGAVGTSLLQQARLLGARVIGTANEANFDVVRRYGGTPVLYGEGLETRVRVVAPEGVTAALDTVGNTEAIDVSLALVADRERIVSIVAADRARSDGFLSIGVSNPKSGPYRATQRMRLIQLAAEGRLEVPIGATFSMDDAPAALTALNGHHPNGKLALVTSGGNN